MGRTMPVKGDNRMDQIKTGQFIAKCRKRKALTQAQLAEKLQITDRAVSKWETGKSLPDPSIMMELCEILGITVDQLLSGEEADADSGEQQAGAPPDAPKRKTAHHRTKHLLASTLFSTALLIGAAVCIICDLAVSRRLTWSPIPSASIVFAWLVSIPALMLGKRGMIASLTAFSAAILPYLFLLSKLLKAKAVFSIGAAMAAVSTPFLWLILFLFRRMGKTKRSAALGLTFLFAVPFMLIINVILSNMLSEPMFDLWDVVSISVLLISSCISFAFGYATKGDS